MFDSTSPELVVAEAIFWSLLPIVLFAPLRCAALARLVMVGVVLNEVHREVSAGYYYYGHCSKYYGRAKAE
jgi:hypothetical protein